MKLTPHSSPAEPADLLIRMRNQAGSVVTITTSPKYRAPEAARAECSRCGVMAYSEKGLTAWAETHAAQCRAA
ncbi:hypothetical protein [Streptomyces sp. NPDC052042]|uniref:hypothetical protein n=1 Tax=Streptomyces sp. NPDC052042 TaxID=3365683 RepID=UPI0037D4310E